ncbi:hypothetical protein JMUB6875_54840 [Nocardia sp. JMUB6875]|uniref:hypothetical protein n=1 Tax=Nocardia sp. JMUB6875 TaxID=3158170 RepID=UPI0032E5FB4E
MNREQTCTVVSWIVVAAGFGTGILAPPAAAQPVAPTSVSVHHADFTDNELATVTCTFNPGLGAAHYTNTINAMNKESAKNSWQPLPDNPQPDQVNRAENYRKATANGQPWKLRYQVPPNQVRRFEKLCVSRQGKFSSENS